MAYKGPPTCTGDVHRGVLAVRYVASFDVADHARPAVRELEVLVQKRLDRGFATYFDSYLQTNNFLLVPSKGLPSRGEWGTSGYHYAETIEPLSTNAMCVLEVHLRQVDFTAVRPNVNPITWFTQHAPYKCKVRVTASIHAPGGRELGHGSYDGEAIVKASLVKGHGTRDLVRVYRAAIQDVLEQMERDDSMTSALREVRGMAAGQ
jgi:hypothetical protein